MTETLATFVAGIKNDLNIGSELDSHILRETRKAARGLERKHNWVHMHGDEEIEVSVATPQVALGLDIKKVEFIWTQDSDGVNSFYEVVEIGDLAELDAADDKKYFYRSGRTLEPNFEVTETLTLNMSRWRFTGWPTDTGESPDLLVVAEDALYHYVMMSLGPILKDPEVQQTHKPLLDIAYDTALEAEAELKMGGRMEQMDAYA